MGHARLNRLTYTRDASLRVSVNPRPIMKPLHSPILPQCRRRGVVVGQRGCEIKIGAIASATGPTRPLVSPAQHGRSVAVKRCRPPIEYITWMTVATPRAAVQTKQLIQQHKVDAIIGRRRRRMRWQSCRSSPGGEGAAGEHRRVAGSGRTAGCQQRWVFKTTQNDDLIAEALVSHGARQGQAGRLASASTTRLAKVSLNRRRRC